MPRTAPIAVIASMVLAAGAAAEPPAWVATEAGILEDHVQLTTADRFIKAGESYFSPDDSMIIFQAEEVPADGAGVEDMYAMFVADVVRDGDGAITGIDGIRRISPQGSANTCGWFHPTEPGVVLFATTLVSPTASHPPGYQRSTGRYRWMFPPEMRIVRCDLRKGGAPWDNLEVIAGDADSYQAEGALSADGRHLVYCSLESGRGDLYIKDMRTGTTTLVVSADGYDGGPFISPEGRRICYRSDRHNDHLLQLFVADLAFNEQGTVVGMSREFQLTDNRHVNWCPYWHPGGRFLVYATSEVGHHNYEVFMLDADPGALEGSPGPVKYGTRKRRITHADGADVLPTFSNDGRHLIWTSKRGPSQTSQLWVARFVLDPDRREPSGGDDHGRSGS